MEMKTNEYENNEQMLESTNIDTNGEIIEEEMADGISESKISKFKKHPLVKEIFSTLKVCAAALIFTLFMRECVVANAYVPSGSMEPTIDAESNILLNRLAYLTKDPERGDIVAFPCPDEPETLYLKRIIGLPGETIECKSSVIYIDGEPLEHDFTPVVTQKNFGPFMIPNDSYFMMGDNRNMSWDSRFWENTYVKKQDIIGKTWIMIYPDVRTVE